MRKFGSSLYSAAKASAASAATAIFLAASFGASASADVAGDKPGAEAPCNLVTKDGRDLNPRKLVLANSELCDAIVALFEELAIVIGRRDFVFVVTGGDRYRDDKGVIMSASTKTEVPGSSPRSLHLSKRAADIALVGIDPVLIRKAVLNTDFAKGYVTNEYDDGHWHFGLAR